MSNITFWEILNIFGIFLVTFGSLFAALSAPSVLYNPDGSVGVGASPDKAERIKTYHRQQRFSSALWILAVGSTFQFISSIASSLNS